jgi:enterochelin esterase-like enzyme
MEEWRSYGVGGDLDRLLSLGLAEPMLLVLPEGEQGYWINQADGGPRWADFVAVDLVAHVDATYPTAAERGQRAIGGLSMGAHGALQIALNHPDVFSIAGAHSPSIRTYERSPDFFGDPAWFARFDPVTLARTAGTARRLVTWLDVGDEDGWRGGVERLRLALLDQGAPLEFHVLPGEHESAYWAEYLPEYLRFYSAALNAGATTPEGAPLIAGWETSGVHAVDRGPDGSGS